MLPLRAPTHGAKLLKMISERFSTIVFGALFLGLLLPTGVDAAIEQELMRGDGTYTLKLGPTIPLSSISLGGPGDKIGGVGIYLGLEFAHQYSEHLALGAELGFVKRTTIHSTAIVENGNASVSGSSRFLLGSARWSIAPTAKFKPFVGARLGLHNSQIELESTPAPDNYWSDTGSSESRTLVDDNAWGLAYGLTGGAEYWLKESLLAGFEVQFLSTSKSTYKTTPIASGLGLQGINGSLSHFNLACQLKFVY